MTFKADKIITLSQINLLISTFKYKLKGTGLNPFGLEITNANLTEGKLKGTASQKWCLLIHLPLILRNINITPENQAWQLMIKCREIGEILMSDSIPKSKIQYLACLIDEHHQLFRLLSPVGMTPKFHYLIHYPRIISSFGPPIRYWTMRFEAKHQYFKDLARKLKNFKNLPHTLATRCQTLQAVSLSSSFFQLSEMHCGPGETIPVSAFDQSVCDGIKEISGLGYFEEENAFSASWVQLNGIKYEIGSLLITSIVQEDIPLFSKTEWIVNIRNKWYIGGKDVIPKSFDEKTWSYECSVTEHISFQELSTMFCRSPVLVYHLDETVYALMVTLPSRT